MKYPFLTKKIPPQPTKIRLTLYPTLKNKTQPSILIHFPTPQLNSFSFNFSPKKQTTNPKPTYPSPLHYNPKHNFSKKNTKPQKKYKIQKQNNLHS